MFYALKQRLQLLLKVYVKQLTKEQDTINSSNYSKVIESVILKMHEIKPDIKTILVSLLAIAVLSENMLKLNTDENKEEIKCVI